MLFRSAKEIRTEDIIASNVRQNTEVPTVTVKVAQTTETTSDSPQILHNHVMPNMPKIDISHKACGVANCMSCAFNVMSAFFTGKHASNAETTPRQHVNNRKHVKSKTAVHTKVSMKTFVPKLKQQVVKAIYKVKCAVADKVDVKIKNVVLPDKGQFFKYAGPKQVWVPRKG